MMQRMWSAESSGPKLSAGLLAAVICLASGDLSAQPAEALPTIDVPEVDIGQTFLDRRRSAQLASADEISVFHDFSFEDGRSESGIDFHHYPVDDGGIEYKMVHYDHGNGVVMADVDGDDLLDIYFTSQNGPNGLWSNRGDGTFRDITAQAGVALADRISMTGTFADYDNDGDPDLFVTTVRMGNVLFENDGSGGFEDVTKKAGLDYVGHSSAGIFFDYDNDGLLDLFLANVGVFTKDEQGRGGYWVGVDDAFQGHLNADRTEHSVLYRNVGDGRFEDVSQATGLTEAGWNGDAVFADLNSDGFLDLYVANMQGDDRFYLNQEGKRFVEATADRFGKTPWGTMGVKFFDFDNNGGLDLLLTDMHSDMAVEIEPPVEKFKSIMTWTDEFLQGGSDNIFGNAFYRNSGEGEFEEISDPIGAENYWPWGPSIADLNADGYEDVFIASSMSFPFRYGINTVLLNDRGDKFEDSEFVLGIEPRADGRTSTPWFELDCSGANEQHALCSGREGRHQVRGTLGTRCAAIFDIEGDGDLDIVTLEFHAEPQVLISDLAEKRDISYLQLRLEGVESNRSGIGAEIQVQLGERVLYRQHDGKSGYIAQSDMPLYLGLGEAKQVDRIEVRWPSGQVDVVEEGVGRNRLIVIKEGSGLKNPVS